MLNDVEVCIANWPIAKVKITRIIHIPSSSFDVRKNNASKVGSGRMLVYLGSNVGYIMPYRCWWFQEPQWSLTSHERCGNKSGSLVELKHAAGRVHIVGALSGNGPTFLQACYVYVYPTYLCMVFLRIRVLPLPSHKTSRQPASFKSHWYRLFEAHAEVFQLLPRDFSANLHAPYCLCCTNIMNLQSRAHGEERSCRTPGTSAP